MRRATPFAMAAVSLVALVPTAQAAPPRVVAPALEECRAERAADPAAFRAEYANARGRHAMVRCVAETIAEDEGPVIPTDPPVEGPT